MMNRVLITLSFALLLPGASLAQNVWKCQIDGKTTFSDAPCPSAGQMLDQRQLKSNTIGAVRRQWPDEEQEQAQVRSSNGYRSSSRSSCPSEQEIKNMETSAGSITLGPKEKRFVQDEVRRARQCARGQGNYNQDDWKQIQQAQREQSSINGGAAARAHAEGIHSAANPYEGDRIAADRRNEDRMREQRRQRAAAAAAVHNGPVHCNARGCNGPNGYYPRHGNTNNFTSPDGRFCQYIGNRLQCR